MDQVRLIQERYSQIHEKIFKFSWRENIPIPGFFKPIDYGHHFVELDSLVSALEEAAVPTNRGAQDTSPFQQYVTALLDAMRFLRDMCKRLHDKKQGVQKNYTMDQYESDIATYHALVAKYRLLGSKTNE